ncbi:glycosyltransferase family 4 protein [Litorivicinus sp.]|nr:glycosyltransferase family 4 protein [Litorivicinus sp.]
MLLSFYYPPDIGPGPLRAKSIVDALLALAGQNIQIDVLTTLPNRYHTLEVTAPFEEQLGQVSITRIALPEHKSGMADQACAFARYAWAVQQRVRGGQWDVVVATSSRLMTASLGACVAKRRGAMLYLDIRDLFTDTMEDVLAKSPLRGLLPGFRVLERWTLRSARQMNVVSAGFLPHIERVAPGLTPTVYTNGIDPAFVETDFTQSMPAEKPVVLYAGNMGEGQGLHRIIPTVAEAMPGVQFRLIGDGGRREALMESIERLSLTNVEILNPVARDGLMEAYRQADVLFLHLNAFKAFHKVLPSKIFEYAATGKPILAGVGGYAANFLRDNVPGVEVFVPCDSDAMQDDLQRLISGPRIIDRSEFCSLHLRDNIMKQMARDILASPGVSR